MQNAVSKCAVEISITFDGTETVEPVPECLQDVFLNNSLNEVETQLENHIVLPKRYAQTTSNCTDAANTEIWRENENCRLEDRERDLSTALEWIKEEMKIMKKQDRAILRQFVALRTQIIQLQCHCDDFLSSTSDLSLAGSTFSLDDGPDGPYGRNGNFRCSPDLELTEFRERTSSLLLPGARPARPVTRVKWKSNEYL
ncbi:hypothetical protein MAR_036869 [Mya arenaria]|uniref:Uncharacterized protein n=1 Tax=Mya arenaria TaxID=6604 RepID=A0ABY7FLV4_MYAAR|nr:uncharacterized protein LOC128214907 [Mya arenaria]WAR23200.1 hypothetical protein MAR_036869 [Mya arenaria]